MTRALFASLAASLLAGCIAEPAEDMAEQDHLPAGVWRPVPVLSECPQDKCQIAEVAVPSPTAWWSLRGRPLWGTHHLVAPGALEANAPGTAPEAQGTIEGDALDTSDESDMGELEDTTGGDLANSTDDWSKTQIPVDSRIRFVDKLGDEIFKVAVSGSTPPPDFAPKTEYWSRVKPLSVDVITLESVGFSDGPGTPKYIEEFTTWLAEGNIIKTGQETSPQQWILGTYAPVAPKKALYWAVDPDAPSTKRIGLLLELGHNHELLSMTWYKTSRPSNGQIFNKIPSKLRFTLVPGSTRPSDIDQDTPWYYFHCVTAPG
ncbi:hypothetical protein [Sorangium sp. So ce1024]|uniref:hypothetical protein n=1 Tax=Sorangium sp. So ce1024 TaxID=3133327 RepID=UPI003F0F16A5